MSIAMLSVGNAPARAALGETADSVAADAACLDTNAVKHVARAALNAPSVAAYAVAQMTTPAAIAVNEYVGPDGKVFAVTWRGRRPPDLSILLGAYFKRYQDAASASGLTAHGLHHASVRAGELEVETAGHMRDMWGRAMLPAMLPPGVERSEIQ